MKPYLLEIKYEFLSLLRTPRFAVPTLCLPVMFYVLFGIVMHRRSSASLLLLCGYSVSGVLCAALWGIAPSTASDRSLGWLAVKRASPMPRYAYFAAKTAAGAAFGLLVHLLLTVVAIWAGHVHNTLAQWLWFTVALIAAVPMFCAMGFLLGCLLTPSSAPGIINMIALPMAVCSGLWFPTEMLPPSMRMVGPWLPPYHVSQIGRTILGTLETNEIPMHAAAMAVVTVIAIAAAAWAWRRDEPSHG